MDTIPLKFTEYPEAEMRARARAFGEELSRRRTVREFAERPVPREIIETCLTAAGTAPNGANLRFGILGEFQGDGVHGESPVSVPDSRKLARPFLDIKLIHLVEICRRLHGWHGFRAKRQTINLKTAEEKPLIHANER